MFPFAHQVLTDRLSGLTDGRSARCTKTHTCPKRFEVNTSNEYWVKAGSLLHSDTRGRDLKDPENVRFYLMSGQSHGVGDVTTRSICQQFLNPVSPYPAHRALLVALDQWVSEGIKPPKSEVPEERQRAFAVTVPGSQTGFVPQSDLGWPDIPGVTNNGCDYHPLLPRFRTGFPRRHSHELSAFAHGPPGVSDFCLEGR